MEKTRSSIVIFGGQCKNDLCHFVWEVLARLPNNCPECGVRLWNSTEEVIEAKKNMRSVTITEEA